MLPPFIIEQIRRREEKQRTSYEQPQLELPVAPVHPPSAPSTRREESDTGERGVVILDLSHHNSVVSWLAT